MSNFVSADWLYEHLYEDNILIIDCRADLYDKEYGKLQFKKGHIPGAQFIDVKGELAGEVKEHGGRSPLPELEAFKEKLEILGISDNTTVIAYDEAELAGAERLWWMLKYIGHERSYVLNGGIKTWIASDYPVTSDIVTKKRGRLHIKLNNNLITDVSELKENLGKKGFILVDSRAPERYRGDIEPIDKKAGHIPGAVNFHWKEVLKENGQFKAYEDLQAHFEPLRNYDNITVQCGSGIDACGNFIAMSEIGMTPKLYVGSFSDWISYEENLVQKN